MIPIMSFVFMAYVVVRSTAYIRVSRTGLNLLSKEAREHPKVKLLIRMLDACEMTDKFTVEMLSLGAKIVGLAMRQFIYPTVDDANLATEYMNRVKICYREMARWTDKAKEYRIQLSELE